jgi:hypothetical protein
MRCRLVLTIVLVVGTAVPQEAPPVPQPTPVLPTPTISEELARERLIRRVAPVYPPEAKRHCVQGNVVLQLVVNEVGLVRRATRMSGPHALADAAVGAAKQSVYEPYVLNGKPTPYITTATIGFRPPRGTCGAA